MGMTYRGIPVEQMTKEELIEALLKVHKMLEEERERHLNHMNSTIHQAANQARERISFWPWKSKA